jgi:hypothetical protein
MQIDGELMSREIVSKVNQLQKSIVQQLNLWLQQKKYSEELTMAAAQMES